jgi:hypothetical protein
MRPKLLIMTRCPTRTCSQAVVRVGGAVRGDWGRDTAVEEDGRAEAGAESFFRVVFWEWSNECSLRELGSCGRGDPGGVRVHFARFAEWR